MINVHEYLFHSSVNKIFKLVIGNEHAYYVRHLIVATYASEQTDLNIYVQGGMQCNTLYRVKYCYNGI